MALPVGLEVQASHLTTILAEECAPPKIEEKKSLFLNAFYALSSDFSIYLFFSKKENQWKIVPLPTPPIHLNGNFNSFFTTFTFIRIN